MVNVVEIISLSSNIFWLLIAAQGTFTTSVSVLLNEANQSIEFTVIINVPKTGDHSRSHTTLVREPGAEEKESESDLGDRTQQGYYFAGNLKTLERTLRTSTFDTVLSFFKLLQVRA